MGRWLRENRDGKNVQSLLQMWWNLWSIARFLNQAHELLKYSRAYSPTPYVLQLISPLADIVLKTGLAIFTWKKVSVHPAESLTHKILLKTLNYIMYMSGLDPSTGSFFTIFQYEKPFAQAGNWNLNSNLLGANCQSKYQHCVTILQSGAQTNNRFHRNISFEFSTSLLTNLLEQKGKYDIWWICIRERKYRMDRTTPQPSPLLLEGQHIES